MKLHGSRLGRRFLAVLCLAALSGCAAVTFKRGASADQMAGAERDCRSATQDDAAYAECMRQQGVFVSGSGAAAGAATPAAIVELPGAVATPAATESEAGVAPMAAPTPVAPPAAPVDPLRRIDVSSWWKLGGTVDSLGNAVTLCVGKLGPQHQPNMAVTEVTQAMYDCLHEAGWRGITKARPK